MSEGCSVIVPPPIVRFSILRDFQSQLRTLLMKTGQTILKRIEFKFQKSEEKFEQPPQGVLACDHANCVIN